MRRDTFLSRAGVLAVSIATVVVLSGCSGAADTPKTSPSRVEATVTTPAISTDGVLSVCTALGLGAIPLFYFDENQEPSGVEVEMAQDLAARLGLEYRAVATAFPSLIPSLDAQQCDVVMGSLFVTDERKKAVDFVPYLRSGSTLIVTADNPGGITEYGEQLCGRKVGSTAGSSASVALKGLATTCEAAGDPLVLTEVDSAATGRQMLLNGQIDVMAGSTADMAFMVAQSSGDISLAGEPFERFEVGAAVRKGNTELQTALTQGFEAMVDDGSYDRILSSVGLQAISYFD